MGVKRFAPMVILLSSLGVMGFAQPAFADTDVVVFDGVFGGTVSKFAGQRKWQPTLWLDGSYGVAGPLHLGAYFQWIGRSWPLENPGFGGGAMIALRGNIKKLRLSGAFTGGFLGVPLPSLGVALPSYVERSGTIGSFVGIGYGFLSWMGLEVRGRWARYFRMPPGAPNHAWSVEAGFSFFID
jgi:hypothetical protein